MGYKREQFVNEVDENLICSICHEVLQDPHGCKEGHSFCKDCIKEWLKTKPTCPMDNSVLQGDNLVRNLIVYNMVQNLEVWCHPSEKDKVGLEPEAKCQWKDKLQSLSRHRETCPFQQVRCPHEKCNETMQRREVEDHDKKCKWKTIQCSKCRQQMVRFQLQDHITDECPDTLIPCPNKCTIQRLGYVPMIQNMKRVELGNHLNNICPKTVLDCQFKDQGCLVRVERQHVDKHIQENRDTHMILLAKQCSSLTKQCSSLTERCSSLTTENKRLIDELNYLKEELHAELSSRSNYDWTVCDYPDLSKNHPNGSGIKSQTFWLRGYRWRIELYPNGDNADTTGFLSLFLWKVENELNSLSGSNKSDNESAIPYRLAVISQESGTDHVFRQGKRVFTKSENNWGWGKFMKSSDTLLPSYCGNGRLIIQCTVEPD